MSLTRYLVALAVAVMGFINVASALLSHPPERLIALRRWFPTEVIYGSRTFTLLAGVLLLVMASGLRRGKRRAFVGAMVLCAVSVPINLLKAVDFEEATAAAALMLLLGLKADAFKVRSRAVTLRDLNARVLWVAVAVIGYGVLGCWWLERLYGPDPSLSRSAAEAAYRLFGLGEPALALSPHLPVAHRRIVDWYLGSLPLVGITALVGIAIESLRPVVHVRRHRREAERVASLLDDYGHSTVSSFALDATSDYFFSPTGRAVIAYRYESNTLLGIGDPIGPREEIVPLLERFAQHCRENDWGLGLFQAQPEFMPLYTALGWRAAHIGEDGILHTDRFTLEGAKVGEVRRAVRKLSTAGIETRSFHPLENAFDPASDPESLYPQMQQISNDWLRAHHDREKGFCMGRFGPDRLRADWLMVAWNPVSRRLEGFVTWVRIPARRGWTLDLMRRRVDAPGGVMEFLVARSVEIARARGDTMLSLGLSALASVGTIAPGEPTSDGIGGSPASRMAVSTGTVSGEGGGPREFLMEHLSRFYDFKGLFHWKKKFNPEFEDRFLVYPAPLDLPRVAVALVRAQSSGGLLSYLSRHKV
jgi:phosphatidylglycerol lysyltransferase